MRIFLYRGSMVGMVMSMVVAPEPSRWEMNARKQVMSRMALTWLPMRFMTAPTIISNMPASLRTLK